MGGLALIKSAGTIAALISTLWLAACASTPAEPPRIVHVQDRNFSIGVIKETSVGDSMVRVRDYWVEVGGPGGGWRSPLTFVVGNGMSQYGFAAGVTYPVVGRRAIDGQIYDILGSFMDPLLVDQNGRVARVGAEIGPFTMALNDHPGRLEKLEPARVLDNMPFQNFELVYSGKTDSTIRVLYREYSKGDLARVAYFQELTYGENDRSIRFKNIDIDVENSSNTSISFSVRRDH